MANSTVEAPQRKTARVAGVLYLFTILAANLTEFYVRRKLIVPADALRTAMNIAQHEQLFVLA